MAITRRLRVVAARRDLTLQKYVRRAVEIGQFGADAYGVYGSRELCVPSEVRFP